MYLVNLPCDLADTKLENKLEPAMCDWLATSLTKNWKFNLSLPGARCEARIWAIFGKQLGGVFYYPENFWSCQLQNFFQILTFKITKIEKKCIFWRKIFLIQILKKVLKLATSKFFWWFFYINLVSKKFLKLPTSKIFSKNDIQFW